MNDSSAEAKSTDRDSGLALARPVLVLIQQRGRGSNFLAWASDNSRPVFRHRWLAEISRLRR
jgi:hypothetical protein